MKKISRNKVNIIILAIVTLFLCMPMFYSKLNVYQDDGIQHIARAYGTKESLKDNFFAPNIISAFSNSFGYSWNLFYGPLSTYGIILFSLVVKNFLVSYKLLTATCIFLSGLFMLVFVKKLTKIDDIGLLAAILYMAFPYHLTDLYTRNALGEFASFVFIPLVFLGIYNIIYNEEKSNKFWLTIGASGLILTHNLSTLIVGFFAFCYLAAKLENINKKGVMKKLLINIVFILLITSFYTIPLIETRLSANYQVYEEGMMATRESVASHGLNFLQLIITKADGSFAFELGIHIIIMFAFSIVGLRTIDKPLKEHYYFFFIAGIISMWMSTKYFPWKYLPEIFSFIQFPWRMMMMTAFFISIICAINMYIVIKKFNVKDVIVLSVISLFCTFVIFDTFIMGDLGIQDIENLQLGEFSGREYETVAGVGKGEYLTSNSYKDKFYLATRENNIYVLEGKALIETEKKDGSHYSAKIKTYDSKYTVFELPYIYYPGYEIRCDGMTYPNFETKNGYLGFALGKNDDITLDVSYEGTSIMKTTAIVSLISLIVFIILEIKECKTLKKMTKEDIIEKVDEKKNAEGENG